MHRSSSRNFDDPPLTSATGNSKTDAFYGEYEGFWIASTQNVEASVPLTFFSDVMVTRETTVSNTNPWRFVNNDDNTKVNLFVRQDPRASFTGNSGGSVSRVNFVNADLSCYPTAVTTSLNNIWGLNEFADSLTRVRLNEYAVEITRERPSIYVRAISDVGGFLSIIMQSMIAIVALNMFYRKRTGRLEEKRVNHIIADEQERNEIIESSGQGVAGVAAVKTRGSNIYEDATSSDGGYSYSEYE
jgi:hypothetical protein